MRSFFTDEALRGPAMVTGPMVWGVSPELAGTGLGALTYAMRHVARVGRPVGGSGMVPEALRRAFERRRHAAAQHQGRPPDVRGRGGPRHGLHRRHRDHRRRSSCRRATRTTRS